MDLEILVLKLVIPVACTYGEPLCDEIWAWLVYWLSSFAWRSGSRDGLYLPTLPLGVCVECFVSITNKTFATSIWVLQTNVSIRLLALSPSTITIFFSDMQLSPVHKTHHIASLKTTTIPTYYGFFKAIPRYIAMQLPPWHVPPLLHCHCMIVR